ncbi:MAG: hypothetical protein QF464_13245, partial [Myxococcota bacterium]|nr:hypothetical protein [Myxococcota bacterium]
MLAPRLSVASLLALVTLLPLTSSSGDALAAGPRAGLQHVGYRILVEPEVVESQRARPGLVTQNLTWKLRSVYADAYGEELLVRPIIKRGGVHATDYTVKLNRAWVPTDIARQSRDFRKLATARKRFRALRTSTVTDTLTLQLGVMLRPPAGGPTVVVGARVGPNTVIVDAQGLGG